MSDTMNLVNAVEEVKEKLSSKEYKDILDTTMKIHNASSNVDIQEIYIEGLHKIMDEIGDYNMRGYANAARPCRVPLLIDNIIDDIQSSEKIRKVLQAKEDWYDGCVSGVVDTYDLEGLIKDAENDESKTNDISESALFYIYIYRWEEIPEEYENRISKLYEWYFDDEDPDWDYSGFNDWDDTYTIDELWDIMYKHRERHYLTYDFLEEISVY